MKTIKKLLSILIVIGVFAVGNVVVFAYNTPFDFSLTPDDTSGVNVKADTDPAVVNTTYASTTSNIVGYAVIGYNSTTGAPEYATNYYYYSGSNVYGKKYLTYYDGYGWIGANRYLEGKRVLTPYVQVKGQWAS